MAVSPLYKRSTPLPQILVDSGNFSGPNIFAARIVDIYGESLGEWMEVNPDCYALPLENRNFNFSNIGFAFRDFKYTDMSDCRFNLVFAPSSDFEKAQMNRLEAYGSQFTECSFDGISMQLGEFSQCVLERAHFRKANLESANFIETCLSCSNFYGSNLNNVKFVKSDLQYSDFSYIHAAAIRFEKSKMAWIDFSWSYLYFPEFRDCDLETVDFEYTTLCDPSFENVTGIEKANFNHARMRPETKEYLAKFGVDVSSVVVTNFDDVSITTDVLATKAQSDTTLLTTSIK